MHATRRRLVPLLEVGASGQEGVRVYATATLCDALESPYRYRRFHEYPPRPKKAK